MFELIEWRAYFKAKNEDKAKEILKQFEKAIEIKTDLINYERYWKDQSLFKVNIDSLW